MESQTPLLQKLKFDNVETTATAVTYSTQTSIADTTEFIGNKPGDSTTDNTNKPAPSTLKFLCTAFKSITLTKKGKYQIPYEADWTSGVKGFEAVKWSALKAKKNVEKKVLTVSKKGKGKITIKIGKKKLVQKFVVK